VRHHCSAVCPPGLEAVLAAELRALGIRPGPARRGGVAFTGTTRQLYVANRWSRVASRVLVRVARFPAPTWDHLEAGLGDVSWDALLPPNRPVHLRVSSSGSRLYHTGAIAERAARVLDRPLAERAGDEIQLIVLRIAGNEATVSLDSSGAALHRRGWRLAGAKAPLRPDLAAAMLLAIGWDGTGPLVDPFGGSGTIAIEAALIARDRPPGGDRSFAFRQWPTFEPGTWSSVEGEVAARAAAHRTPPPIVVSDRDRGATDATRQNAERAGVAHDLTIVTRALSDLTVPAGADRGWLVSNPPYGRRVAGGGDLRDLYSRLGQVVREQLPGWSTALLVADTRLAAASGLRTEPLWRSTNGGLPVTLLTSRPVSSGGA
jgi:putative N6-adenine-specific DNA methylase